MLEQQTIITQEQESIDPSSRMDADEIERCAVENTLGSRRDLRKGIGALLPKMVKMGADIAESSSSHPPMSSFHGQSQPHSDTQISSMVANLVSQNLRDFVAVLQRDNPGMRIPEIPMVNDQLQQTRVESPLTTPRLSEQSTPGLSQSAPDHLSSQNVPTPTESATTMHQVTPAITRGTRGGQALQTSKRG